MADKAIGLVMFIGAVIVAVLYGYAMIMPGYDILAVKIIVSLWVLMVILIGAWLGTEMMRTPGMEGAKKKK